MSPHSRTICHISKIPSEIRQLITSNLSGKSTLQAESIELDSALDFGCLDEGLEFVSRPPLEALLKDLPGETKLELTEAHHLIEIEPMASAMSSAEVHGAETAHGNAVNSATPKPRLPSPSSAPRPPMTP